VREIDALDGIMAAPPTAPASSSALSICQGPACAGRAPADRKLYRQAMQALLAEQTSLKSAPTRSRYPAGYRGRELAC